MTNTYVVVASNSNLQIVVFGPYTSKRAANAALKLVEDKYPSAGAFITATSQIGEAE